MKVLQFLIMYVPQDYSRASDEKQIDVTLLHLVIWLPYKKSTDWKDSSKWSWRFSVWISFNRPLDCANRKWQLCSQDHNGKNPEAFEEFPCFFAFESQLCCCCCWLNELNFFSVSEAMVECNLGHRTVTTLLCKLVTDKRWTESKQIRFNSNEICHDDSWATDQAFWNALVSSLHELNINVSLQLRVQNWTTKWHFPLNFWTAAYPELLLKGPSFSCYRMDLSELPNHTDLLVLCIIMSK